MKAADKGIILGVVIAIVLVGFYVKVLSPKREKASQLSDEITKLKSDIDVQEQNAAYGEDARRHFPAYYGRMVVLGKAVPDQADTASLLVELNSISGKSSVDFKALQTSQGSGAAAAAAPSASGSSAAGTSPTPSSSDSSSGGTSTTSSSGTSTTSTTPSSSGSSSSSSSESSSSSTATPAASGAAPTPATEASAASAPLGSTVGPNGLSTLPYSLSFQGTFFDIAGFFSGLDSLNHVRDGGTMVAADGRLLTLDGFALSLTDQISGGSPVLQADLAVTTYVTPASQGLTAGASPGGPAPSLSTPETQTTSATVSP
jgi:Tfp pilus assembly protein PilO